MALPLAAVGAGIFVPVRAAEQVGEAIAIHVQQRDALGVIVAEAMREESNTWRAAGPVPRMLQAKLGGVCGVLSMAQGRSKERQREQWRKSCEGNRHHGLRWCLATLKLHRLGVPMDNLAALDAEIAEQGSAGGAES